LINLEVGSARTQNYQVPALGSLHRPARVVLLRRTQ